MEASEIFSEVRANLGDAGKVRRESQILTHTRMLQALSDTDETEVHASAERMREVLGGHDPSLWLGEVLGRRAWALTQALYQAGATPVFAEDPHLLVPGCPTETGTAITKLVRTPSNPSSREVGRSLGGGLTERWRGYAALALLVEAEIEELGFVLEGYDRNAVWDAVWPGGVMPGDIDE
jgi:hypothetical protein